MLFLLKNFFKSTIKQILPYISAIAMAFILWSIPLLAGPWFQMPDARCPFPLSKRDKIYKMEILQK